MKMPTRVGKRLGKREEREEKATEKEKKRKKWRKKKERLRLFAGVVWRSKKQELGGTESAGLEHSYNETGEMNGRDGVSQAEK